MHLTRSGIAMGMRRPVVVHTGPTKSPVSARNPTAIQSKSTHSPLHIPSVMSAPSAAPSATNIQLGIQRSCVLAPPSSPDRPPDRPPGLLSLQTLRPVCLGFFCTSFRSVRVLPSRVLEIRRLARSLHRLISRSLSSAFASTPPLGNRSSTSSLLSYSISPLPRLQLH